MKNIETLYGDWLTSWLAQKREYVKEATHANYQTAAENHLIPTLGMLPLGEVTEKRVQDAALCWMQSGRCGGGALSERTVRSLITLTKQSMYAAAKEGLVPYRQYHILFPKSRAQQKLKVLTKEEQLLLMQHVCLNLTPKNLGIFFCLHTGLRIGELCALQWQDINLTERTVTVSKTIQRISAGDAEGSQGTKVIITPPKSATSNRTIPLSSLLYPLLKRMNPGKPGAYLLTNTETYTEPRTYRDYYKRLLRTLGLPPLTFHALRHTFASRLIENGADYKTVSELLGHASVNVTLNLYVHPHMEQKRKAVELMSGCY